ncbi:amidohydrolase family protein [Brassicibacter mesophilus]|uniref:amidohydrolase family protein n=1 Tax=Brassicibacter mesophilus TaxID=745119 RepID=UPI003D1BF82A
MKIIDAHLHFSRIESFNKTARDISIVDYSASGLIKEFEENNIIAGIGMGLTEEMSGGFPDTSSPNPMKLDIGDKLPNNLAYCIGVNPVRLLGKSKELELENIEAELKGDAIGIKIYAGYYQYYVYDTVYDPVYALAEKYNVPVTIHSGDTYSDRGILKYSHPLTVDELAVKYRGVKFIIAHLGDPWVMDTAEIIRKNPNVFTDLSGLIIGDSTEIERMKQKQLFIDHIKRSLVYADNYYKVLFGSDWPLVQLKPYIEFIKEIIPEEFHEYVFYKNALSVFNRLNRMKTQKDI